ncbi:MAG: TonB-dependent receptor [Acidobacteriota bacterium]
MKKFLAVFLFAFPLFAQQKIPTKVTDQIVVTASELPETVESTPASVTVITKEDIDKRAARDVADLLREVPGLFLARSGSPGKATSLFTRGAASTQTLVLWNGIEINNPYFSGYDWGRFSTAGIEQIEIVRGPFSALYGSEAMAGVINILTAPRASGWRAEVESGAHGLRNAGVGGTYASEAVQLSGAYEHREDDGFAPNDDFRQNSANAMVRWSPAKSFSIGAAVRHTSFDLGVPFNTNAAGSAIVPSPDRRQDGTETQVAIPLVLTLGRVSFEASVSEARRRENFSDPQDPFGLTATNTDSTSRRARLLVRAKTALGTIVAGGEIERAEVDDVTNFGPNFENRRRRDRSLVFEDRYTHAMAGGARLELSVGVRRDDFDEFGTETSPRIAAAFVTGGTKWRAAFGRGFRAPSLGELYYPFFGNPNVKAERNRSIEVGWDTALGRDGIFSATYFNSRDRDLITFSPVTFVTENIGRVKSDGVELGLEQHITPALYTAVSYTYLHRNEDESTGQRLFRRPKHSGSIFLGYRAGAVDTNIVVQRIGVRDDQLPVFPYSRVANPGYTTIDANIQHRGERFTPFVKVENLRDARYEEVRGYAAPRRRFIVGLRLGS